MFFNVFVDFHFFDDLKKTVFFNVFVDFHFFVFFQKMIFLENDKKRYFLKNLFFWCFSWFCFFFPGWGMGVPASGYCSMTASHRLDRIR